MKRKFLALFLILVFVACLFPASAFAATGIKAAAAEAEEAAAAEGLEETSEDPAAEAFSQEVEDADAPEAVPEMVAAGDGDDPMPPDDPTPEEITAAAALAEQILSDGVLDESVIVGDTAFAVVVGPDAEFSVASETVTVTEGETAYAYEGMIVFNNGGTVYNNLATVYNNGGLVFNNGGTVYNNAGIVYANNGTIYNNTGKVYNNDAEIFSFSDDDIVSSSRVYRFYELKFADYYEPFILVDGVVTEPGSESMMIGEGAACHISPYPGYMLKAAETDAGDLVWDEGDGSLYLTNVDADTTLTLTLQADAPAFGLENGTYAAEQTVTISGPAGCRIYYSLDGSTPDAESGTLYEEAFPVSETCTVRAVAVVEGVESSEVAKLKLSFLSFTAPEFTEEKEGYFRPVAQAIMVKNPGDEEIKVVSVVLDGENADAFSLSSEGGKTIPAGGLNDTKWSVRPVKGLAAGIYEASAVFTLNSGETVEVPLCFTVVSDGVNAEAESAEQAEDSDGTADVPDEDASAEDVLPEEDTVIEDAGI